MNLTEWVGLTKSEQDSLASEYGITRSGVDNCTINEEELLKIPEVKKEKKEIKKADKPVKTDKPAKRKRRKKSRG